MVYLEHPFSKYRRERLGIEESKNLSSAVLFGTLTIFVLAIVSSLIFAFLLRFSSLQESSVQYVISAISFLSIFLGGFISGGRGKQKGWMLGGITGVVYSIIIFLYQFLGLDTILNFEQIIYHICYILIAMMGGILGVNLSGKSRNN
ncbi:TIGR04086 family membrane protein [Niallia oryzisoli]|uniref:TIGR04086 family membrane protein n=1 Tax=Niallia oryzisoli TaxID=1737571 RepID=UPI0037354853